MAFLHLSSCPRLSSWFPQSLCFSVVGLFLCLVAVPVTAADRPTDEQATRLLLDSLQGLEGSLAAEPPSSEAVRRALADLRQRASASPAPLDDLLTRLEGQLGRLAAGAETPDRLPELRRRAGNTLAALRDKLDSAGQQERSGASPTVAAAAPGNDSCANATAVTAGTVIGSTADATNDGSASCGGSGSSPDVWYSYTAPADGLVTFDTEGSLLDTVLSLHSACPDVGGDYELACNDDWGVGVESLLGRQVANGEAVLIRVSGAADATGSFQLTVDDTRGGFAGTVSKEGTGEPIPGAHIEVRNEFGWWQTSVASETDGTFLVPGLEAGDHYAQAFHDDFLNEIWEGVQCTGWSCAPSQVGTPISVAESLVEGIDFSLAPGGAVSGRLTEEGTGEPFSRYDAFVSVYTASGEYIRGEYVGSQGHYVLSGLPEGDAKVVATAPYHRDEVWDDAPCDDTCDPVADGTTLHVENGSSLDDIDFVLTPLGSISGRVEADADGAPASFIYVVAADSGGSQVNADYTDANGIFLIPGLQPGDHFVYTSNYDRFIDEVYDDLTCTSAGCPVTSGTPVPVSLATTTTGVDFGLAGLGEISGTLTTTDGGWFDGYVQVFDSAGYYQNDTFFYGSNGTWQVSGLPPGTYYVKADPIWTPRYETVVYSNLGCQPSCNVTAGTPITVEADTLVTGIGFLVEACSAHSYRNLANLSVVGATVYEACREIRVTGTVTVNAGAHLDLIAGQVIVLGNGFRVEAGGSATLAIDSDVASD